MSYLAGFALGVAVMSVAVTIIQRRIARRTMQALLAELARARSGDVARPERP